MVVCIILIVLLLFSDLVKMLCIFVYFSIVWVVLLVIILVFGLVGCSNIILVVVLFCIGCVMVLLISGIWKKFLCVFLMFLVIVVGIFLVLL